MVEESKKEGAWRGDDGSYEAKLVSVDLKGPFQSKQNPGEEFSLYEWGFAIEGAPDDACLVWATSSTRLTPRSKSYGYITALFGGKQPPVGTKLDIENQLVGRPAVVTVQTDPVEGWVTVTAVTPPVRKAGAKAVIPPAPESVDVAPADGDDVPF